MKSLDEIGIAFQTDKASVAPRRSDGVLRPGHDFLRHYERAVRGIKARPQPFVLDLGVGMPPYEWASAKMWRDYFGSARVLAVDFRKPEAPVPDAVEFRQGNLGDLAFLVSLARGDQPDLVVEDASHLWHHQILSLVYLLPHVSPGGVFIWEDTHTSHARMAERFSKGLAYSPAAFLADISTELLTAKQHPKPNVQPFTGDPPGITEAVVAALVPLIDRIEVVTESVIFHRR